MSYNITDIPEVSYGGAYGSGVGPPLIACQGPYDRNDRNFVPVGDCSFNRASNLTCNHENDVGIRCSKGQCK